MTPRYGQLSYTSFDAFGAFGGWQVKQTAGGITPDEARTLVSGIHIAVNYSIDRLPSYPTPTQLKSVPRRLSYRRIDDDRAAYWHTAPAGLDSMGRPGNVFAHVLLDRDASQSERPSRPIELWRSAGWLTPYGARAVSAATLPAREPDAGGAVTPEGVVEFACDTETWRLNTLCGLLDAVAAAMTGGPAVVLGVDSPDAAAQWIGVVSFLMSPGTARRLSFSTFDRSSDVKRWPRLNHHLVGVPRTDLADLADVPRGALVIDEAEKLSVGEFHGENHRTARGQEIEVTAWSAMAQVAFLNSAWVLELLTDIDEISADSGDVGLPPALPMALSVSQRYWGKDAVPEAESVIGDYGHPASAAPLWRS
ncbi:hypothetical protein HMPREF0591_2466 [Mycobacterium parascrofulaceum ATCC BAA-614]|uniref:Uncharacterized protein n=1 Tax=Mycobacterium parascrofulaceum ATCC BAA-614 TaxID=525368 RepID=D5P8F1_9MYCO|nr:MULTISPECIES: hypothetical protein [Mycobacterium]EFG77657.1 hypothetical protein HMPREF0591_2466 [Mycobacterium parascrofulaceum ATCC BAA-614]OCB52685.1 hypothetical protein A9X02_10855 [Mycobacterium malmoense]